MRHPSVQGSSTRTCCPSTSGARTSAASSPGPSGTACIPVCDAADNRCKVCGQPGYNPNSGRPRRPDCQEPWHFEVTSTTAIQRLAKLIALCPDCHRVQHTGHASVRGELSMVVNQLRAINSWTDQEIQTALENASERYQWRRRFDWDLDLSSLKGDLQIHEFPDLIIPASNRSRLGNSYLTE